MITLNYKFFKYLIKIITLLLMLIVLLIFIWFFSYRFILTISTDEINGMKSVDLEGYTNKMFYFKNDTIKFYLKSKFLILHLHTSIYIHILYI